MALQPACFPHHPGASGQFSLYSVPTTPTHTTSVQNLGYAAVAVACAFADSHNSNYPAPAHTSMTLCDKRSCASMTTPTGQPWARNAGHASELLACFDSESRVLRVANIGAGGAFLGHCVSGANNQCTGLVGPESPRYLDLMLVDDGVFAPRGA